MYIAVKKQKNKKKSFEMVKDILCVCVCVDTAVEFINIQVELFQKITQYSQFCLRFRQAEFIPKIIQ